ncbi:MAG: hypothetical protein CMJ76_15440 [Planctomycetaceae bacterium]|nr:hypothetical protein [Planctomycetaceae bacterium]|tara:strand:+ start:2475 stop:4592 length:2118 start_codon:yes stop_codon:yes gene_type:complete
MDTATLELGTLDYVIFFGALIGAMAIGMWAGRKEDTSEDYFLAGKGLRWFGVAGSIFGSNVSANHMVGMMGVGFSIGFAQSHFEIGAILGLLLLCFGFLPVYRKLNLYTLSEYLGKRYDDRSRVSYALIMIIIMAGVQMIPALYIGSRTICELMGGDAIVSEASSPEVTETTLPATAEGTVGAQLKAKPSMKLVSMPHYTTFVIALGLIAGSYTILGGLKAVVYTDIIQSVLMLIVGIGIAILVFSQFSWGEMVAANDTAIAGGAVDRMSIYLPTHHPQLPWTGVLTGLMFMHCFYWGTNQFIVQRALGAVSDKEARVGIIAAGFLKLLIPFFSIGTGVCAYFLLTNEDGAAAVDGIAPDTIFPYLVNRYLAPIGLGLIGLVAAGVIGAILSSIDSMMNSAATIISVDIWKRFINPQADDKELIFVGKLSIVALMISAILMALFIMNPNSESNFFLDIANYQNYLTPGLLVAFILGIFWKRGTGTAAFVTIIAGVVLSWVVVTLYDTDVPRPLYDIALDRAEVSDFHIGQIPTTYGDVDDIHSMTLVDFNSFLQNKIRPNISSVHETFGPTLNFFHRVVFVIGLSVLIYVVVSLMGQPNPEKSQLTWTALGGHDPARLKYLGILFTGCVAAFAILAYLTHLEVLTPLLAASLSFLITLLAYLREANKKYDPEESSLTKVQFFFGSDLVYAGVLAGLAMFMMFYFF